MSDITKDFCPKCKTGIANPNICNRCGINVTEYIRTGKEREDQMETVVSGPRPGGNRYAG
jgi:hypothetical protein